MTEYNKSIEEAFEGTRYLFELQNGDFGGPPRPAGELVGFQLTHVIFHNWESDDGEAKASGEDLSSQLDMSAFIHDTAYVLGLSVQEVERQTAEYLGAVDPELEEEMGDYWREAA